MGLTLSKPTFIYGNIAFCLVLVGYFCLSKEQRTIIAQKLRFKKRRPSSADTPPRSVSPDKRAPPEATTIKSDYARIFPPSQRDTLLELADRLSHKQREALGNLEFDQETFESSLLDWRQDYRTADNERYVYSGFSIKEIKALGSFPDYATLSGVPLPQPYTEFDITKALPRPYRPFRWNYYQTMALFKMDVDWWLELENTYESRIAQRKELFAKHGEGVLQWLPGSELACKELMEMSLQFLCARYPQYFSMLPSSANPNRTVLENRILGTTLIVEDMHPLLVLLETVPEDFAIMLRNSETGLYQFRAGIICSALGWNVASKIDKTLAGIHGPVVPDYTEKMEFSMDRYFSKKRADKPIQRTSWGLEVDEPLYMPPGDPHEKYRDIQDPNLTIDRLHLRTDHQTLRRLPLSGAVVFNFKALFTPVQNFRHEPYIPSLVLKVCKEGKENLMKYKNTWHIEHVALPALERYEKEQIEKGMIEKDWEVRTLDESPFYPGWEALWHEQQGF